METTHISFHGAEEECDLFIDNDQWEMLMLKLQRNKSHTTWISFRDVRYKVTFWDNINMHFNATVQMLPGYIPNIEYVRIWIHPVRTF